MKKTRWMNDKTIGELKKTRGFLHRMGLALIAMFMFFLMTFLYSWCFTTNTLVPLIAFLLTILSLILFGIYILKRDIWSIMVYLKETKDGENKEMIT